MAEQATWEEMVTADELAEALNEAICSWQPTPKPKREVCEQMFHKSFMNHIDGMFKKDGMYAVYLDDMNTVSALLNACHEGGVKTPKIEINMFNSVANGMHTGDIRFVEVTFTEDIDLAKKLVAVLDKYPETKKHILLIMGG